MLLRNEHYIRGNTTLITPVKIHQPIKPIPSGINVFDLKNIKIQIKKEVR